MKKRIINLLLIFTLALSLVACNNGNGQQANKDNGNTNLVEKPEKINIKPSEEEIDMAGFAEVETFNLDFSGSTMDSVSIYIKASKDDEGEFLLDDGQDWLIIANNGSDNYILFEDYVQLGSVDLYTSERSDGNYLITEYKTGAGLIITEYKYNVETKEFESYVVYNMDGNVNKLTNY